MFTASYNEPLVHADVCVREIETLAVSSVNERKQNFVVMVAGPRKVGKSTLCRKLMNLFLAKGLSVYHLECDPGQTEFTPPGCLALTKILSPVNGDPYTHLRTPISCKFFGETSPANRMEEYIACVRQLILNFRELSDGKANSCLVINTAGWIEGAGLTALREICCIAEPSFTMFLDRVGNIPRPGAVPSYWKIWQTLDIIGDGSPKRALVSAYFGPSSTKLLPSELREAAIFWYFGYQVRLHTRVSLNSANSYISKVLCASTPYMVPMNAVFANVVHGPAPPSCILSILNGSLVALCQCDVQDDSNVKHWMDDPSLPMILEENVSNIQCLGFGLIRATDLESRSFYIVTPIPKEELSRVNAVLKGDVSLPASVFLRQEAVQSSTRSTGCWPYVVRSDNPLDHCDLVLKMLDDRMKPQIKRGKGKKKGSKKRKQVVIDLDEKSETKQKLNDQTDVIELGDSDPDSDCVEVLST